MASRIQQLQEFINEDPSDPFNIYALALEYQKSDLQKAIETFNQLLSSHPDYVPTYYQLGKIYQDLSQDKKALSVFETGIVKAGNQHNSKALHELQAARQELLSDY